MLNSKQIEEYLQDDVVLKDWRDRLTNSTIERAKNYANALTGLNFKVADVGYNQDKDGLIVILTNFKNKDIILSILNDGSEFYTLLDPDVMYSAPLNEFAFDQITPFVGRE